MRSAARLPSRRASAFVATRLDATSRWRAAFGRGSARRLHARSSGRRAGDDQVVRHQLPLPRAGVHAPTRVSSWHAVAPARRSCARRKALGHHGQAGAARPGDLPVAGQGARTASTGCTLLDALLPVYAAAAGAPAGRRASSGCRSTSRCWHSTSPRAGATPSTRAYAARCKSAPQAAAGHLLRRRSRTTCAWPASLPVAGLHIDLVRAPRRAGRRARRAARATRCCRSASSTAATSGRPTSTPRSTGCEPVQRAPRRPPVDRAVVLAAARAGRPRQRDEARCRGQVVARVRDAEAGRAARAARRAERRTRGRAKPNSLRTRAAIAARRSSHARAQPGGARRRIAAVDATTGDAPARLRRSAAAQQRARFEPAAVADHHDRLVPADRRDPRGARRVQGAASSTQPATTTAMQARDRARRARAGSARPRRAGARRGRAQRHGRVLRRAARRLRLHASGWVQSLRLALREAADHLRRRQPRPKPMTVDWSTLRAVADRASR